MRKNKMMRAASGVLVATLMTTSIISGTFAKYTTSEKASDDARVAKWGVTITANGTMFADEYATDDTSVAGTITKSVITSGATGDAVIAPGTKGTLANATLSGKPEVAVHVEYAPTLTLDGWKNEANREYCPIVFTVGTKTYGLTGMKDSNGTAVTNASTTVAELKTAVENAIKAYSTKYEPNTDLSTKASDYVKVSWNWAFDNGHDADDTYLGNLAADSDDTNDSSVKLEIQTTVTQID